MQLKMVASTVVQHDKVPNVMDVMEYLGHLPESEYKYLGKLPETILWGSQQAIKVTIKQAFQTIEHELIYQHRESQSIQLIQLLLTIPHREHQWQHQLLLVLLDFSNDSPNEYH